MDRPGSTGVAALRNGDRMSHLSLQARVFASPRVAVCRMAPGREIKFDIARDRFREPESQRRNEKDPAEAGSKWRRRNVAWVEQDGARQSGRRMT